MKILMVCLGNICRSPMAEAILKNKCKERNIEADVNSAGLEPHHLGQQPDERTVKVTNNHGLDISDHVMRLFSASDFDEYDQIYVMDQSNWDDVMQIARNENDKKKVKKILSVADDKKNLDVPYLFDGKYEDFEKAYVLLDEACTIIANSLQ